MRVEQIAIPMIRAVVNRPKLAELMFRFDSWGNPLGPDRYSYPYPIWERVRADGPVAYKAVYQQWFVTGYEETKEILSSKQMIVAPQRELMKCVSPYRKMSRDALAFLDNLLLLLDPPVHTRLRGLVNRAFTPRQVARMEPAVERVAARHMADLVATITSNGGSVEVVDNFAGPFPINVICELLGLPEDRWRWAMGMSEQISRIGNVFENFDPDDLSASIEEMRAYFLGLAQERRANPKDDLISVLASEDEHGDRLSDDEFIGMVGILMFAGHDTTSGLIGNSIIALAQFPEQRTLIRDNPDLWPNAIEELLRWDTPVQTDPRTAAADFTIGSKTIKKGQNVLVLPGAANRDPRRYEDPNVLRLDRPDPQPVSFGHGLHHCLGHALARMEGKIALRAFTEAFGNYTVDEDTIEWKQSVITRGPTRLNVHANVQP